jgi:hypothetical protein
VIDKKFKELELGFIYEIALDFSFQHSSRTGDLILILKSEKNKTSLRRATFLNLNSGKITANFIYENGSYYGKRIY